ncbi:MAG TPA: SLOG family protein [Lactovum miscens]|uniref:SLOG family protein n=1 Tax=Lactovum miscens TaxID=190387 RepID=UPI002ED88862
MIKNLLVQGYSAFDLGIFSDKDPKLKIIKKAIDERLETYLNDGLEWLVFGGNLGFEYWVLEEARKYSKDYGLKCSTIFPFKTHGQNWNEANRAKLQKFKQVDFVKYSFDDYQDPGQFRAYDQFLIENTDAALVLYDSENETKLHFLIDMMGKWPNYPIDFITFENLQNIAENENGD